MAIPTDIEIFGYRNVEINQRITDTYQDKNGLRFCNTRVQLDMKEPLIIDLGHGRQIRITFYANKVQLW